MSQEQSGTSATACVTIDPAVRATPVSSHGQVLLNLTTGRICAINTIGASIWTDLDAGRTIPEIVDRLVAEYDAPRDQVERDVSDFIVQLVTKQYVRTRGTAQ